MVWGVQGRMVWGVQGRVVWGVQGRMVWGVQGVQNGRRPPALQAAILKRDIRLFQGWPPAGHRTVRHGGP
jgi:hypothetical protein